jgi:hypothetical protein
MSGEENRYGSNSHKQDGEQRFHLEAASWVGECGGVEAVARKMGLLLVTESSPQRINHRNYKKAVQARWQAPLFSRKH